MESTRSSSRSSDLILNRRDRRREEILPTLGLYERWNFKNLARVKRVESARRAWISAPKGLALDRIQTGSHSFAKRESSVIHPLDLLEAEALFNL